MDCIYTVNEYYGAYGYASSHQERASKSGDVDAFFPSSVAFIEYTATPGQPLSYTVKTAHDEVVAMDRWNTSHESPYIAAISVIESACEAVQRYDCRTICMIGDKLAEVVIEAMQAAEKHRLKVLEKRIEVPK